MQRYVSERDVAAKVNLETKLLEEQNGASSIYRWE